MNGKNQTIAKSELLIRLKEVIRDALSNSNNPHNAMFILKTKPNKVSQIPLFVGRVLINLKIKMGAISIAISINGTSLLILVNIKMPNPNRKYTTGKYFFVFIFINNLS